jgi:hypothetical protein
MALGKYPTQRPHSYTDSITDSSEAFQNAFQFSISMRGPYSCPDRGGYGRRAGYAEMRHPCRLIPGVGTT